MKTKSTLLVLLTWALAATNGLAQPHITNQPPWLHVCRGSPATLCLGAEGTPPLSYQWREGSAILPGETNATLIVPDVQANRAFTVIVSNSEGSVTSAQARVNLNTPFGITQQPVSASVETGATFTCSVTVTSQVTPSVQWYLNGQPLAGKTTTTLTIANVQSTNAGQYWLQVTNACRFTNSQVAELRVGMPTVAFTRITTGAVATDTSHSYSCSWIDYDNDGYIDLFVSSGVNLSPGDVNRIYHNNRDGTFSRMTTNDVGGIAGQTNGHAGCAWADYDNDGWMDLLEINPGGQQLLWRNTGMASFTAVTNAGPLVTESWWAVSPAWGDYDQDGLVDAFVTAIGGARNKLFRNLGNGVFNSVTGPFTDDVVQAEYPVWSDVDGDGDLDLVVSAPMSAKLLAYRNQGAGQWLRCTNAITSEIMASPQAPTWGDYDNNGSQDLFVAGWNEMSRLFRNDGSGQFTTILMGGLGEAMMGAWGDCDNDGDLDLYVVRGWFNADQKALMYFNNGDGTFTQTFIGSQVNVYTRSGACAWGDYDNDGFLDLIVAGYGWKPNLLFHNDGNMNRWIMVKLAGTPSNRAAIGAKVRVMATVFGKPSTQLREISGGGSSQNDLRAHFGLGDATNVESVRVEWPSSRVTEWHNLAAGQILTLTEPTNDLPVIVTQPPWRTNCVGTEADFPVVAMGAPPLHYQWREGAMALTGATNATLEVVAGHPNRQFTLVVSNAAGSVTSSPARLYVVIPITITSQPPPTMNLETGATFVVSAAVSGTAPSYQWYFDGQPLAEKTSATLTIANVQSNNAGCYHVTAHNACGSVPSAVTCLKVVEPGAAFTRMTNLANFPMINDPGAYWGSAWVDYDKDGDVDLFVTKGAQYSRNEVNRFYRNDGGGYFTRLTTNEVGSIVGDVGGWYGCTWGDYDNDGFIDVSVILVLPNDTATNALYRNNGHGRFARIWDAGPLETATQSPSWVDFDNDGWLDLFHASGFRDIGMRMALYRNSGNGTFSRVPTAMQYIDALNTEVGAWGDFDGDGNQDLVVTDDGPATYFFRNNGHGAFARLTNAITLDTGFALVPAWADYDNDGRLDLFMGHFGSASRIFHNEGGGQFTKMEIGAVGENAAGAWGDYDNDGDLDLMLGGGQSSDVRQQFFQNNGDGTFTELKSISPAQFVGRFNDPIWGDYDNDGFLDLFLPHMATMNNSLLYHNEGNTNHWLMATLEGTAANRTAIGAKVQVLATISGRTNWQMREVSGGKRSQNDLRAHFGLGDATNVQTLRIEWPSGHVTEIHDVAANQILNIQEPPGVKCAGWDGTAMCIAITGNIGECYQLRSSADIAQPLTNWTPWLTITNTSRTMLVTNTSPLASQRFHTAIPDTNASSLVPQRFNKAAPAK